MRKFVIDPTNFKGHSLTVLNDEGRSIYGGETLDELKIRENNPNLQALSDNEFWKIYKNYEADMCKDSLKEITEEQYWEAFGDVPPQVCPTRYARESFIHGEPFDGTVRSLYFKKNDRYFTMLICSHLAISYIESQVAKA